MTSAPISSISTAELVQQACAFLTASTDPYHAVANSVQMLEQVGFVRWNQSDKLQAGGQYYYTVHHSTLVAFTVGPGWQADRRSAFHIVGGHTDSPNLRVKPRSLKKNTPTGSACRQLGVECYGGGLWHTWLDRDLGLSGKVVVRHEHDAPGATSTTFSQTLVQIRDPVARVSSLCIHLQTDEERRALQVGREDHTSPIVASTAAVATQEGGASSTADAVAPTLVQATAEQLNGPSESSSLSQLTDWHQGQEPLLLQRLTRELNLGGVHQLADWDLSLFDTQPAAVGGLQQEFLYSGRLDNLATVFCAVQALIRQALALDNSAAEAGNQADISMIVCFDHEEVGSVSSHGAGSPVLGDAIQRVHAGLLEPASGGYYNQGPNIARSFCISMDQAHALHPNYSAKHESQHAPAMNQGLVIKSNANQRYTTNSLTGFLMRELARQAGVPIQEFCVRNDCPCGSTIGPTISARTGIRTVDLGMPQLSMHSCREVMGVHDLLYGLTFLTAFFQNFRSLDDSVATDG